MTTPRMTPPRRYRRLIERVCASDSTLLARRPNEDNIIRPYCPGEWWPLHHTAATHVRVSRLADGYRARQLGVLDARGDWRPIDDLMVVDHDDPNAGTPDLAGDLLGVVDCREAGR